MRTSIRKLVLEMIGDDKTGAADIFARTVELSHGENADDLEQRGSVCVKLSDQEVKKVSDCLDIVAIVDRDRDPNEVERPFVLCGNLLYTRRKWRYEQIVRAKIAELANADWITDVVIPNDPNLSQLRTQDQLPAVSKLLERRFSILTGGPGTGKTFTLGKAVKLLQSREPNARIGLAAPTAKAAQRINESLAGMVANGMLAGVLSATTLHSLLRPHSDFVTFKYNAGNPLPLDWLVVDEASMIDLPLMAKLLEALPENCSLTLIGDEHQLASVEEGRVFGDLCRLFAGNVSPLTISHRFPHGGVIDRLAHAVNSGADDSFGKTLEILREGDVASYCDLSEASPFSPEQWCGFADCVKKGFVAFAAAESAADALAHLNDFRILCAVRRGPFGMNAINDWVKKLLGRNCPVPMMITRNDKALGVANGDVGVIMPGDERRNLHLPGREKPIRIELLPDTELAFASTVHKSQGSEYNDVAVLLPPDGESPLLTREILYTAITRTKGKVYLYGSDKSIKTCCERKVERVTGLS